MLIVINGPPGVGKTTVSRALAKLQPATVCIHGDHLRTFAPEDARAHLGRGSTYRAGAALACKYVEMGASRVIFDYCFLRPRHVEYFVQGVPAQMRVHIFTLWASLPTVQARERGRIGRSALGVAVDECHREIEKHLPELGDVVEAEHEAAESIANLIHELVVWPDQPQGKGEWMSRQPNHRRPRMIVVDGASSSGKPPPPPIKPA